MTQCSPDYSDISKRSDTTRRKYDGRVRIYPKKAFIECAVMSKTQDNPVPRVVAATGFNWANVSCM